MLKLRIVSEQVKKELNLSPIEEAPSLSDTVKLANKSDSEEIVKLRKLAKDRTPGYTLKKGVLLFNDKIYVPELDDTQTKLID